MKQIRNFVRVAVLLIALGGGRPLLAGEPDWLTVAVFDFESADSRLKESGAQLAGLLTAKLSTRSTLVMVERQDLAKLLGEQELGVSGLVNSSSAARIGQLTGARVLVTGRVFTAGSETTAVLKIMGTETGRVFVETMEFAPTGALAEPAEQLAAKVASLLQAQASNLVANVPSAEDRAAKLKQKFAGRSLPSVSIAIPEQHFGAPVVDPAAETEIGLILNRAGFKVLSGEGAAGADFKIGGEAFSEAGVRRGNLISSRARVEVKVVARVGGVVAIVDRQVAVAVDTAEHIAAKAALQQAGDALAERIAEAIAAPR